MLTKKQLALISVGTSLSFWDIFNVPYIENEASAQLGSINSTLILSAEMIGYFTGGAINGLIASKYGRKIGIILSMLIIFLGSTIGFFSTSFLQLAIAEFIIGFGIEGEVAVVPAYVSEMSSANFRGRAVGFTTLGGFLMSLVVGPVAVIAGNDWRILFLPSLIISAFALIFRITLPESKMWEEKRREKMVWDNTVLLFLAIWFTSYFAGYSLFSTPVFSLLSNKGFSNTSLYFTYILYGDPIGVTLASILNDKLERKFSSSASNLLSGIAIISMPLIGGISLLIAGFIAMFFQGFKFPTMYAYTAENLGTKIRSLGYGIADGIGHLGGAVGPILFTLTYGYNAGYSFLLIGIVSMISGVMLLKGARVKGKSLEEIKG
ncbi:major facilitator superfamily MFS_1 [Acidianus hospitalis W1]|uniref:Major facilitator superfamily MFS_1 n=1 Tax=Acidianus hospitalis (strain W1) TaxID=933801 RepID=F4B4F6_ACIHW|nr:MFS transporter [Acidianus hospitalis]AEE93045.1 major facilitator superfamily MFS_1 [Acidianus hospitalis W1]